jgi:4-amino-4-deoxy-L-arabinose transferase-like glycosyltransferase
LSFLVGLGRPAIGDADEGFYAESAREMIESGDWLTPHFNYRDRWEKPVLYYWLTAATYLAAGPSEWAARFWSALSGIGLVLLAWGVSRRMTGSDDAAWLAGAITATCYGYSAMARAALPDLPLTFLITLAIWAALEQRWALAGLAAGLGFLMKGPVAVVIPGTVLLPIWLRERSTFRLRPRDAAIACCVFIAAALPWYLAMTLEHGTTYLQSFFVSDNLARFATDRFNEPRPVWFYIPVVIGGMAPWSIFLLVLAFSAAARALRRRLTLDRDEWRLLIWALAPLLFYTASIGKQPRYILPVLPPLAILVGRAIADRVASKSPMQEQRSLRVATSATAILFVALALTLLRARPVFITALPALTWLAVAGLIAASGALAWVAASRKWERLPMTMAVAATVLMLGAQFGALSGLRPEPVERMASLIAAHRRLGEPVGTYQVFVRNLIFYSRIKQVELVNERSALDFMRSPERVLMVVSADELARLEGISGLKMRRLANVEYLNAANIKLRTLLWPMPNEDLQTVLLVTNQ